MSQKLMLLDGYSLINRAFYAIAGKTMLSTQDGIYTNAIFGFLNMLNKLLEDEKPDYLCVGFDVKKPTFRHEAYEAYKLGRRKMPEELKVQIPYIRNILEAMNIKIVERERYEADDILGTLSKKAQSDGFLVVVVSGDRDLLQIVDTHIRVKVPVTKGGVTITEDYTKEAILEKYNLEPKQLIELKGIMGDSSDNIPGVKGVGEKTALPLIQKYGSIDNVYEHLEDLKASLKLKFEEQKESAYLSKRLATIVCDVEMDVVWEDFKRRECDKELLLPIFQKLEFKTLTEKFLGSQTPTDTQKEEAIAYAVVKDETELKNLVDGALKNGHIGFYFGNASMDGLFSVYAGGEKAYVFDCNHAKPMLEGLKTLFENQDLKKYGYQLKESIRKARTLGVELPQDVMDLRIAGYLLDSSSQKYSLKDLALEYSGLSIEDTDTPHGAGDAYAKAAKNAYWVGTLGVLMQEKIHQTKQEALLYDLEMPLVQVLESMETEGIRVDKEALKEYWDALHLKIVALEQEIFEHANETFLISSPKKLAELLFDKLGLPVIKKTKTGYSTDVEVLEQLKDKHPIIESLLLYRQMEKLKNTYAKPLYDVVDPVESKIHTSFVQTGTVTGRITSVSPNLQNIPYKQEYGRRIRKVFVPRSPDHVLIDADYSQIELRILAHVSGDENLIQAFIEGRDIHMSTAAKIFELPEHEITPLHRSRAKAVNFGILYGLGEFSLAKDLGVSRKEAKQYIEGYLGQYPDIKKYMTQIVERAREDGFVTTILGRRRRIPEIHSPNFNIRSFGERVALNAPIQGSAADVLKLAMLKIYRTFQQMHLSAKLILQVHDEILIDAPKSEEEAVKRIVKESMEQVHPLQVPLLVEVKVGDNWYETK
jgi:DNA polymerase I